MSCHPLPAPAIDPLARTVAGRYRDDVAEVRRGPLAQAGEGVIRTPHFVLRPADGRVLVEHELPVVRVDDDLAGLLAEELFNPGWLRGADLFARVFTGLVLTADPATDGDPLSAWELFYRHTLDRVAEVLRTTVRPGGVHSTIAGNAPVYAHAESLLGPGSVLELGCCFGFLSLRLAAAGREVTASDVDPGTCALLAAVAPRLVPRLRVVRADAARYPGPAASADTVLLVHLLEHLEPDHGHRTLTQALRVARRRVVVAVPFEDEPNETWGHVRTLALPDLVSWGQRLRSAHGVRFDAHDHHGGWLVIDR